jgi:hypothetical protein
MARRSGVGEKRGHAAAPLAGLLLATLAGCGPSPQADAAAPVVAIEPSQPGAAQVSRPEREVPLVVDDGVDELWTPGLDRFVRAFVAALTSSEPTRALRFFAPANRDAQRSLGVADEQYIAEGIGLYASARTDGGKLAHDPDHGHNLALIERVMVSRVERDGSVFFIQGQIWLRDGRRYGLELLVEEVAPGRWAITPPLG